MGECKRKAAARTAVVVAKGRIFIGCFVRWYLLVLVCYADSGGSPTGLENLSKGQRTVCPHLRTRLLSTRLRE